jgi:prepilin-type N-terminal cleavage/methylation domain-containing protein
MVRPGRAQGAFSLIEIIAVLGVIAIIAAAALPALVQRIDYAAQTTEAANLGTFAAGLTQACSRQRTVPKQADLATFIAASIGWHTNAVSTNAVNNARAFLIDPGLVIGTIIPNPAALPYVQSPNGSGNSVPPSARFVIVSSLSSPLPNLSAATDFTSLWNNPDNTIPATSTWNGWTGHGADIKIQRINLASSFNLLTLANFDTNSAPYNINATNSSPIPMPPNTSFSAYFLRGTVVNLYYRDSSMNITTQACHVLQQDVSWVFSSGLWRIAPLPVSSQSIVQTFYTNAPNPITVLYPTNVCNDMINYMIQYTNYAASGFAPTIRNNLLTAYSALTNHISSLIVRPPAFY